MAEHSGLMCTHPVLGVITILPTVIDHLTGHRQTGGGALEAGGQLFARIHHGSWTIVRATGPRRSDWRSRFGFRPDRKEEQKEIEALFEEGFHYVGDWHTHPELVPTPSSRDLQSMAEQVSHSNHQLPGFVMIIVGLEEGPRGLSITFHDGNEWHQMVLSA